MGGRRERRKRKEEGRVREMAGGCGEEEREGSGEENAQSYFMWWRQLTMGRYANNSVAMRVWHPQKPHSAI